MLMVPLIDPVPEVQDTNQKSGNPFKVDDVLVSSWGYEQTNIDFFQVVKASAKTVTLRPISSRTVATVSWLSETVEPVLGDFCAGFPNWDDKPFRSTIQDADSGSPYVHIKGGYAYAHLWNNRPHYASQYA